LRIIYFGTPGFAVPGLEALLASRHQVIALVSQPDKPKGRGQRLQPTDTKLVAEAKGIAVLQPTRLKSDEFLNQVRALNPDLGVVAAYGRILPDALLAIPGLGMINIHASLLPAYRGAAPVHRAVINGDAETGVSIMQVVTTLDAGPVFTTASRPIGPDETTPEVERDLARLGATLVVQVVDELAAGTARAVPQDDGRATLAPRIEKHEGAIEWTLPAADIHNRVRGLQPWPLVSAIVDGRRLTIHRTALTDVESNERGGTIVSTDRGDLQVAAGDGRVLRILVLQPEGKRPLDAREFLNGHPLRAGMRFTAPARGAE
jgi:methionyl-tRNA formyltransferase